MEKSFIIWHAVSETQTNQFWCAMDSNKYFKILSMLGLTELHHNFFWIKCISLFKENI